MPGSAFDFLLVQKVTLEPWGHSAVWEKISAPRNFELSLEQWYC